jgi:hypothetical protein
MEPDENALTIRSFRVCFKVERRLHKIDRFRIPLPYGLPVRGLVYGAVILLAVLIAGKLPLISLLVDPLHPIVRYAALPLTGGYLLTELTIDGRSGHQLAASFLRLRLQPRRLVAFKAAPAPATVVLEPIPVAPDERGPRLRRGVIEGEGRVVLRQPARLRPRGRTLRVTPEGGDPRRRGQRIDLRTGQRVVLG